MCILCVVQRWSRRIATMLPWLVLPLILLWAFSQLLPPGYRFEVTSPRLACVSVLLLTLFWYEILLPQLSLWRARRSERLREERLAQALKLQKLRKTATRRCRNCSNPYRDQNPAGGKFMCSYCGHISKRPVLDLPGLMSPEGKNRWTCSQDWSAEGNGRGWAGAVPWHWLEDRCSAEKSYNGVLVFSWRMFSCFFSSIRWVCRRIFPFGASREDEMSDEDRKRAVKRGENGSVSHESRLEKARRKAEEKRVARLEKEMLEEEERKQREEVARLVEERRKLRDEKQEAEERSRGATPVGEKEIRKEVERRRLERRKEKDKGSSKSNSDCEELDRSVALKEAEKKREYDRKSEAERRDTLRGISEVNSRSQNMMANKNKYFGRVTGNFLSSSRGLNGASFFGRGTQNSSVPVGKTSKLGSGLPDQATFIKQNATTMSSTLTRPHSGSENRTSSLNIPRPVVSDAQQPRPTSLKKSWHQLFTRSSSVSPSPDTGTSTHGENIQSGVSSILTTNQATPVYPLDNQLSYGQPMPFTAYSTGTGHVRAPSLVPFENIPMCYVKEPEMNAEEPEHFEDPCYDPNAIALLGPVSESLDNFPLDLGSGFISADVTNKPHVLKNRSASREISKPSPIESPLSKSRVSEEKHMKSSQCSTKKTEISSSRLTGTTGSSTEKGAWQMWDTPLVQSSLGLGNAHSSWFLNAGSNFRNVDSLATNRPLSAIAQTNGGTFSPVSCGLIDSDLWGPKNSSSIFTVDGKSSHLPSNLPEDFMGNDVNFGSTNGLATVHPFELPPANGWSKEEWLLRGSQQAGDPYVSAGPHIGSLFPSSNPDVQSLWSFNQKEKA